MNTPQTIDDVIARLSGIVEFSIREKDRKGYFAALYNRVTETVRRGVANGEFEDGPRMERLDVLFANRYLEAYDLFMAGRQPSSAWGLAFQSAARDDLTVLQHLLLGMNAHIHLDLGIAAAETCRGGDINELRGDFNRINQILGALMPQVEQELDHLSREFALLNRIDRRGEEEVGQFLMSKARDEAWRFATALFALPPEAQPDFIRGRDDSTATIGKGLLDLKDVAHLATAGESRDVANTIMLLAQGEFN